jgi:hypothetical protein
MLPICSLTVCCFMTFVILLWYLLWCPMFLCFVYWLVTISDYLLNVCLCLYNSFHKFHVKLFLKQILWTYRNDMICMYVFLRRQVEKWLCIFTFSHTVNSTVSPEKISSPTPITLKVKSAKSEAWRKNTNYWNE